MKFGIGKHSNRSQPALEDQEPQRASASQRDANNSAARLQQQQQQGQLEDADYYDPHTAAQYSVINEGGQRFIPDNVSSIDPRSFSQDTSDAPSRSQSQRYSTGYPQPSGLLDNGRTGIQGGQESNTSPVHKSYSTSGPNPRLSQAAPPLEQKKKSRNIFGFPHKKDKSEPVQAPQSTDYNNLGGLGRRASKSLKQTPPQLQRLSQGSSDRQQGQQLGPGYPSAQSSDSHLPSTEEGEEDREFYHQDSEDFEESPRTTQGYDSRGPGDPRLNHPSIRVGRAEGDSTVRQPDESPTQIQYLQQQQQRLAQHQAQLSQQQQVQTSVSTENLGQDGEYQAHHNGQYQQQSNQVDRLYTNLPYRGTQNPEVVSQLSRESPTEGSEEYRPNSSAAPIQPPGTYPISPADYSARSNLVPGQRSESSQPQQGAMAPPPGGNNQNRRSADAKTTLGAGESRGPPPGYPQFTGQGSAQGTSTNSPLPPTPNQGHSGNFRGTSLQRDSPAGAGQARSTLPLAADSTRSAEAAEMDQLVGKYKKVKKLFFEREAQVVQLQNTLANQRLSQSRTSLDDSEYITRFNRLDGAIKEIAFSIRKDWRSIPLWLQPYVNSDAQKVGTKEMTAVGRAAISKWIYDEIFCKCFHPGLELGLSADLKRMEQNIRRFSSPPTNQEEETAMTSKVIQWKLTTIDALADRLASPDAVEAKDDYTRMAISNLTAHLMNHLVEASSQGIEGNATSIIELAVGICTHLPKESREISIIYPLPGDQFQPSAMKAEAGLPPLESSMAEDIEGTSISSGDKDEDGDSKGGKLKKTDKKHQAQQAAQGAVKKNSMDKKDLEGKVRFAAFMGVDVKGRQWLFPSPVWTFS